MRIDPPERGMRVLLLAPTRRDGEASRALLGSAGIDCVLCRDLETLCECALTRADTLILPEEAVLADQAQCLAGVLRQQPVWSDLPVVVLSRAGVESPAVATALATLGNVSVVERPVRVSSLLSVVRTALRARARQYQVRDQVVELRASEARYRTLFETIDEGFCVIEMKFDTEGRPVDYVFIETNPAFERHSGLRDSVGRSMRELVPGHEQHWFDIYGKVALTGESVRFINEAEGMGGRWFDVYAFRVGEPAAARVAVLFTDITNRRRDEIERESLLASERAARAEAERAGRMKDEFLATLSHELRTPLTPVLLTVSLMETNPLLPAELREDVETIRRNVELESHLISDLLDLTRIEKGKLQLDVQEVDLHRLIKSAIEICQRDASARMIVRLDATAHTVRGDSTRLQQVFWNLINNAIKFTPDDGSISVCSFNVGEHHIRVEITDTGDGIHPDLLPRLFDAFEQGDVRANRQQAGLGLGLAISRKLAEAHDGTITAQSEGRGRGATFTVDLPVIETAALEADAPRPAGPPAVNRSYSVLLVEDHEPTLNVMSKLLRRMGHRVTGATSVASAAAAAGSTGFDLIISDLGLPDGSGLDLMRKIRDHYAGRAIALTGYGMDADVAASLDAGFVEHITKPVDLAALQAAMHRVSMAARASNGTPIGSRST